VEDEDHRQAGGAVGLDEAVHVLLEPRAAPPLALKESWTSMTSSAERSMGFGV